MVRAFLNWLITKLGGVTMQSHWEIMDQRLEHYGDTIENVSKDEIFYLRSQLESERARCEKLQEMIFRKFGILLPNTAAEVNAKKALEPIQTSQLPWPERKRRLEQLDRDLARQQAKQTPESKRTEEHWRAQGAVPVEQIVNERVGEGIAQRLNNPNLYPGIDKDLETLGEENAG